MKKQLTILFLAIVLVQQASTQQYYSTGLIEYEVRVNNHRMFGDGIFAEMIKNQMPQFSTSYYHLIFDKNKSVYKFDRYHEKEKPPRTFGSNPEENIWYSDFENSTRVNQKFVYDQTYIIADSLMHIEWKLVPNETREIAGFNCRKAQAVIFDSVYVFAFYTDEITIRGGPMGIHGLPGMIMGITIPRMFTSWIATKLQLNSVNTALIQPPTKGRKRPSQELKENILKATKDWGNWGQQSVWNIFL